MNKSIFSRKWNRPVALIRRAMPKTNKGSVASIAVQITGERWDRAMVEADTAAKVKNSIQKKNLNCCRYAGRRRLMAYLLRTDSKNVNGSKPEMRFG